MAKRILTVAFATAAAVAGCVPNTATPYQSEGLMGGYDEEHVDGDSWRVFYRGNSLISFETAETYWLFRSANLTLERGFDGFSIIKTSEEKAEQGKPVIEGTIVLLKRPFTPVPGRLFDARAVEANLAPVVAGAKCEFGNVCIPAWSASVAKGLFLRIDIFNITHEAVLATVGEQTRSIHPIQGEWKTGGFAMLPYPRGPEDWRHTISTKNCAYVYDMPRDLNDDPWRVFSPYDTDIPTQLAEDMSLHVVSPHPGYWEKEFSVLIAENIRPPIVPKKTCR